MGASLWEKFWDSTNHATEWLIHESSKTVRSATRWLDDRPYSCLKCHLAIRQPATYCPACGVRFVPEAIEAQTKHRLSGLLNDLSRQKSVQYLAAFLKPDHPVTHRVLKSFVIIAVESEGYSLFMLFNVTIFSLVTPGTAALIPLLAYLLYHHRSLFAERSLNPLREHLQDLKESLKQERITKAQYLRKRDRWIEKYMVTVFTKQAKKKKQ